MLDQDVAYFMRIGIAILKFDCLLLALLLLVQLFRWVGR